MASVKPDEHFKIQKVVKLCVLNMLSDGLHLQNMKRLKYSLNSAQAVTVCRLSERELLSKNPDHMVRNRKNKCRKLNKTNHQENETFQTNQNGEDQENKLFKANRVEGQGEEISIQDDSIVLISIFKYYASYDRPFQFNRMNINQFLLFAFESLLISNKQDGEAFFKKFAKRKNESKVDYLEYDSWIQLLHSIAKEKYPNARGTSNTRFNLLKRDYILEYSRRRNPEDLLSKMLSERNVSKLFQQRNHTLRRIYDHFKNLTFDVLMNFVKAFNLVDCRLSEQIIEMLFEEFGSRVVHVLSYTEFVETIGRMAVIKYFPSNSGEMEGKLLGKYFNNFPPVNVNSCSPLCKSVWFREGHIKGNQSEHSQKKLKTLKRSHTCQRLKRSPDLDLQGIRYSDSERYRQKNVEWIKYEKRWMNKKRAVQLGLVDKNIEEVFKYKGKQRKKTVKLKRLKLSKKELRQEQNKRLQMKHRKEIRNELLNELKNRREELQRKAGQRSSFLPKIRPVSRLSKATKRVEHCMSNCDLHSPY